MNSDKRSNDNGLAWAFVAGLTVAVVVYRLVPYLCDLSHQARYVWNLTPVGALALFAGARLRSPLGLLVPLAVMALSDVLLIKPLADLGMRAFSWGTPLIYAAFLTYALLGRGLVGRSFSPLRIGGAAVLGAVQFFLLTNFAVWLLGDGLTYPKTLAGLLECYAAGVPFYRQGETPFFLFTLAGDLLYSGLFFGLYAVALAAAERRKAEQPA
jgi:hypothetical protein